MMQLLCPRFSRSPILQLSVLMTASRFSSLHALLAHAASRDPNTAYKSLPTPSSLQGPAIRALVEPGLCQFDDSPKPARLLSRTRVSSNSHVLRFELPDASQPLQLTTCACILAHTTDADGQQVTRPYTPISTNAQVGSFDLLVKDYSEYNGIMSHYLCQVIQPADEQLELSDTSESSRTSSFNSNDAGGDYVAFTHVEPNVKISASDELLKCRQLYMLAGGTGISPMLQALHAVLGGPHGPDRVVLLYGSKSSDDILAQPLLDTWASMYKDRLDVVYILSQEPDDSDWQGPRGVIDKTLLQQHLPAEPVDDLKILVCGPPPLYDSLCGPRTESDKVTGVLAELGYTSKHVYKF